MRFRIAAPLIFLLATAAAFGQSYTGFLDVADCSSIVGWAWDSTQPNASLNIDLYDGATLIETVAANLYRGDIGGIYDGCLAIFVPSDRRYPVPRGLTRPGNGVHDPNYALPDLMSYYRLRVLRINDSGPGQESFREKSPRETGFRVKNGQREFRSRRPYQACQ